MFSSAPEEEPIAWLRPVVAASTARREAPELEAGEFLLGQQMGGPRYVTRPDPLLSDALKPSSAPCTLELTTIVFCLDFVLGLFGAECRILEYQGLC